MVMVGVELETDVEEVEECAECTVVDGCYVIPEVSGKRACETHGSQYRCLQDLRSLGRYVPRSVVKLPNKLTEVRTPLRVTVWRRALESHPDREFVQFMLTGVQEGFRIGYDRCRTHQSATRNMKSANENSAVVEQYLHTEMEKGRVVGPLNLGSVPGVQISPFGVIPKSRPGEWGLIVDLSSPEGHSVNDGIDKSICSLQYVTINTIVEKIQQCGSGALLGKLDIKSAYRIIPVHPDDRLLLGMKWKGQLFIDTALPFSLRSAPKIFNAVACRCTTVDHAAKRNKIDRSLLG